MIRVAIADLVNRLSARVTPERALLTSAVPYPPHSLPQKTIPFRQYLTTDGTASGTNDMQTTGTTAAPVDYFVPSHQDRDRYITQLSFIILDGNANLNEFGNITALTNGCRLWFLHETGEIDIHDALKSNWDFVRLALGSPAFGDGAGGFRATNATAMSEAYIPVLDLTRIMPPYGIKIDAGSQQLVCLSVRDDTTGVDQFDCIAYGFERLRD